MKKYHYLLGISIMISGLISCNNNTKADGYGNFEATEITVAAESNGKLIAFDISEGALLQKNEMIGCLDTVSLALNKEQLEVAKAVISSKSKGVLSQIKVLNSQLKTANINKTRIRNLMKDGAATQKQLDDVQGEINVINSKISSIEIQNASVVNELKSIDVQIKQVADQMNKSKIINPIKGTVLTKYAEVNEITSFGKPLYKIADLSTMELRVYVSETQLAAIKIGQKVTVKVDEATDMKSYPGTISWIASQAEFTPKIIQTKEERVALVYAVKVKVKNDGGIKIGMPGEMWMNESVND